MAHGTDQRGDEMPAWVADKQHRLEKIRAARARLEAEAAAGLDSHDSDGPGPSSGMRGRGVPKPGPDGGSSDAARRDFTDPDSRIQPTRDGVIADCNAGIAVDAASQAVVPRAVRTDPADFAALVPLRTAHNLPKLAKASA